MIRIARSVVLPRSGRRFAAFQHSSSSSYSSSSSTDRPSSHATVGNKDSVAETAPHFASITVLGGGQMGAGIAQTAATFNYTVNLVDMSDDALSRGQGYIIKSLKRVAKMRFKGDEPQQSRFVDDVLSRIKLSTDTESAAAGADLIIEAIIEQIETKRAVFGVLDKVAPAEAILASNTSSLPIGAIGEAVGDKRKGQLAGLHFFNPVPQMKLVEIVRTERTTDETIDRLRAFAKSIDKAPVLCRDTPGFIVNRLLVPYLAEAIRMLERGDATAEDIDTAMKCGAGYPMGPFQLLDYVGLDTVKFILDGWYKEGEGLAGSDLVRPSEKLDELVRNGRLGVKSGAGFYDY
ncbi:hypothetical protein EV182_000717 [Spiromyces aspiralis]|uniref:Uncharacterized protein n=1 Tax=Spiromyces aspiralis TaxID=68401 RepID=A0ACC1HI56_9FUNG|nr:hypothetical protein EV182_000717 [Spiromyces aspiralis]